MGDSARTDAGVDLVEQSAPEQKAEAAPKKPRELTPEALERENRQGDRAIALLVVLMGLAFGFFTVADFEVWRHLKTGWLVATQGVPRHDPFCYVTHGRRWICDTWLYDWALFQIERFETRRNAEQLALYYETELHRRSEPTEEEGVTIPPVTDEARENIQAAIRKLREAAQGDDTTKVRWAADELVRIAAEGDIRLKPSVEDKAALITLKPFTVARSLIWGVLIAIFLTLRVPGPTLWWTAACAGVALLALIPAASSGPFGVSLLFLLATLAVMHRGFSQNPHWLWLLVPLFLVWANVHGMFALGLAVAWSVGLVWVWRLGRQPGAEQQLSIRSFLPPLIAATVATFVTPYGPLVWLVPLSWLSLLADVDYLSGVSAYLNLNAGLLPMYSPVYLRGVRFDVDLIVAAGLLLGAAASFWLPGLPFRPERLLLLTLGLLPGLFAVRNLPVTALIGAVVLILNGQEWFVSRFGTEVRVSRPWVLWSRLGRGATVLIFLAVTFLVLSGRVTGLRAGRIGWGIEWAIFDLPFARMVHELGLKGNVLNTTPLQGDLLLWYNRSADNGFQVFFDGRTLLHRHRLNDIYSFYRRLSRDEVATEELNRWSVTAVTPNRAWSPDPIPFENTFLRLVESEDWSLVGVAPSAAIFVRVDEGVPPDFAADRRLGVESEVDPQKLAFRERVRDIPELEPGPPPPIYPPTLIDRIWPHFRLAGHVETMRARHWLRMGAEAPTPAECLLAMRTAHRASAAAPTSPDAWYTYAQACGLLLQLEQSIARGRPEVHRMRRLELLAAFDQAIAADPFNYLYRLVLGELYEQEGYPDLAAEQYEAALKYMAANDPGRADIEARYDQLTAATEQMRQMLEDPQSMLPSPELRAQVAASRGFLKLAIEQITEMRGPFGTGGVDSSLLSDYYIRAGKVAHAFETLLQMGRGSPLEQATPGLFEEKWGFVHLMRGDYRRAKRYWESSLAKQRHALAERKINAVQSFLLGNPQPSLDAYLRLTDAVRRQAATEYYLGLVNLEMGEPDEAARHFHQSLQLIDDNPFRPLIAYYLKVITGEEIEPHPTATQQTGEKEQGGAQGKGQSREQVPPVGASTPGEKKQ